MNYPFECECGHKEIINMPMKEYHADNHYCPICNKEMTREVKISCVYGKRGYDWKFLQEK